MSFFGEPSQFPGAGSSLRTDAGLEDVLDESCGGDVEDELVPDFDDNPMDKRYEIFSFTYNCLPFFGQPWFLIADPLIGAREDDCPCCL